MLDPARDVERAEPGRALDLLRRRAERLPRGRAERERLAARLDDAALSVGDQRRRGEESAAVILLLFAQDYEYDDLAGEQHESTTITAEKKLARDVRDFLVQARARNLP